jgi:hypothetical protein
LLAIGPIDRPERTMSILKKLFGQKEEPRQRTRICVECGMPVAEHKDWCSIRQLQEQYDRKTAAAREQA